LGIVVYILGLPKLFHQPLLLILNCPSITISVRGFLSFGCSLSWSCVGRLSLGPLLSIAIIAITASLKN
jgi:hypothetical protein